jgi:hypothetical protein
MIFLLLYCDLYCFFLEIGSRAKTWHRRIYYYLYDSWVMFSDASNNLELNVMTNFPQQTLAVECLFRKSNNIGDAGNETPATELCQWYSFIKRKCKY